MFSLTIDKLETVDSKRFNIAPQFALMVLIKDNSLSIVKIAVEESVAADWIPIRLSFANPTELQSHLTLKTFNTAIPTLLEDSASQPEWVAIAERFDAIDAYAAALGGCKRNINGSFTK